MSDKITVGDVCYDRSWKKVFIAENVTGNTVCGDFYSSGNVSRVGIKHVVRLGATIDEARATVTAREQEAQRALDEAVGSCATLDEDDEGYATGMIDITVYTSNKDAIHAALHAHDEAAALLDAFTRWEGEQEK